MRVTVNRQRYFVETMLKCTTGVWIPDKGGTRRTKAKAKELREELRSTYAPMLASGQFLDIRVVITKGHPMVWGPDFRKSEVTE